MPAPNPSTSPNKLLAFTGCALAAVGGVGLLLNRSAEQISGFVVIGGFLLIVSVVEPRLVGTLSLGWTGARMNLNPKFVQRANEADNELADGSVRRPEEI